MVFIMALKGFLYKKQSPPKHVLYYARQMHVNNDTHNTRQQQWSAMGRAIAGNCKEILHVIYL